jgi:N-methylhydantoinase B
MVTPIFYGGRLVGFAGTAAHLPDIGATAAAMGPTELISEGLLIPPVHLYRGGRVNEDLVTLLRSNVRLAEQVWGDLQAQLSANSVCRRRAVEFLEDTGRSDFEALARAVRDKADRRMRRGIAAIPDGRYRSVVDADGVEESATHIECAVTIRGETMEISYSGSSKQLTHALNCTLAYTTAYSLYPVKLLIDPFTRSNHGTYRAIRVSAPLGSILNPEFPAPVLARHLTGHLLSCAIYRALADVLPDAVIADSGGAPALRAHFAGIDTRGKAFALVLFASGGMGASSSSDGLSTTAFPTNSGGGSIEALEVSAPLLFTRKTFRPDSGGAGKRRGGLGQDVEVKNLNATAVRVTLLGDRERHPPLGITGGRPGACASAQVDNGTSPSLKSVISMAPGATVTLSFAGGGGFGDPRERAAEAIAEDIADGLITSDGARRDYGVDTASRD